MFEARRAESYTLLRAFYETMRHSPMKALHFLTLLLLIALISNSGLAAEMGGRRVAWDTDPIPEDWPGNPFNMLLFMYTTQPVKDHLGENHDHGHVIQLIQDGGNRIQDPPNPDGSPGGDDSLALGNFNLITMRGIAPPFPPDGKSGQFYSAKYFIPLLRDEVYYLRIWEGNDVTTAPYYQNSLEYSNPSSGDKGGAMVSISPRTVQGPQDLDWLFGKSIPRPKK